MLFRSQSPIFDGRASRSDDLVFQTLVDLRAEVDLSPEGEKGKEGFGGGLAADGGMIFATTGFGEIIAVSATSGEILWRQSFGAPFRAAPTKPVGSRRGSSAPIIVRIVGPVMWYALMSAASGAPRPTL